MSSVVEWRRKRLDQNLPELTLCFGTGPELSQCSTILPSAARTARFDGVVAGLAVAAEHSGVSRNSCTEMDGNRILINGHTLD